MLGDIRDLVDRYGDCKSAYWIGDQNEGTKLFL